MSSATRKPRVITKLRFHAASDSKGKSNSAMNSLDYFATRPNVEQRQEEISLDTAEKQANAQKELGKIQSTGNSNQKVEDSQNNNTEKLADRRIVMLIDEGYITDADFKDKLKKWVAKGDDKKIASLVISTDEQGMTRDEIEKWVKKTLDRLEIDDYAFVVHAKEEGHTPYSHAHVLLKLDDRLPKEDLINIRTVASKVQIEMLERKAELSKMFGLPEQSLGQFTSENIKEVNSVEVQID